MDARTQDHCVEIQHGSGGRATAQLVERLFQRAFNNPWLNQGDDSAVLPPTVGRLVVSTDAHVVSPLFFPGGDIGSLAVNGTINDIAMAGAWPRYLTASFILEAGFSLDDLEEIVTSMAEAARSAGVAIVCGDTKVVERGKADGVFITTTGVGFVADNVTIRGSAARPGDAILLSGSIGEHGLAVLSKRENLQFDTPIKSDTAALHELVRDMLHTVPNIHCLRDPTRGGVATSLNEIAKQSGVGMTLQENAIPVSGTVQSACEIFGLDPLYIANEGKLLAICAAHDAHQLLAVMRAHPLGKNAAIIGEVVADAECYVQMQTVLGGRRIVDWLMGDPLPRIC